MADFKVKVGGRVAAKGSQEVAIYGLDELKKKLKDLPDKIRNKHLRATVREGAKVVLYDAIHRVDPLPSSESGLDLSKDRIKKRLGIAISKGRRYANYDYKARIGVRYTSLDIIEDSLGQKTFQVSEESARHWRFVEFGTSKMAARPFLQPAFSENQSQIQNIMIRRLKKAIDIESRATKSQITRRARKL